MAFSRRLLHEGEEVVLDARPHGWFLVAPVVLVVLVGAGGVTGLMHWRTAPGAARVLLAVVIGCSLLRLFARILSRRATSLVITSSRVIYRSGVLRRFGREIPLEAVQDVSYQQGLFGRIVGKGSLTIESAGERSLTIYPEIARPERAQSLINHARTRARPSTDLSLPRPEEVAEQLEHLDEMRRRGVITEHEFAAKRSDLLGAR